MATDGKDGSFHHHPNNVQPLKPALVRCLGGCNHFFYSPDRRSIRICPKCKANQERLGYLAEHDVSAGIDEPPSEWEED